MFKFFCSSLAQPSLDLRICYRPLYGRSKPFSTTHVSNLSTHESRILHCIWNHHLQDARDLLEDIPERDSHGRIVHWTSILTRFSKIGFSDEARALFDIIPEKNIVTYNVMLTGYIRCGKLIEAWRFFHQMPRNVVSWTAMLCGFSEAGRIDEAKKLFDEMPERNIVSWNSMVTGLIRNGDLEGARRVFDAMPCRSVESYNAMISGYVENRLMDEARVLFEKMNDKNVITWTSMISGYCRIGDVNEGFELFRRMPERNVVSWTAMIGGFAWNGFYEEALLLFLEMNKESSMKPNTETFISLSYACAGVNFPHLGKQVHARAITNCLENEDCDGRLSRSFIHMYASFGLMDYAEILFDKNYDYNTQSWNCMINGYVKIGSLEAAQSLFDTMPFKDKISWTSMIEGCLDAREVSKAFDLFQSMPDQDAVAWTTMISGLVRNELFTVAAHLFSEMHLRKIQPLNSTYSVLFGAAGATADLDMGRQLHCLALKSMGEFDLILENSLISTYAKSGEIRDASEIFFNMATKNSVSWNSMIIGYSHHGLANEALRIFEEMLNSGAQPNSVTFLGVLSACSHAGLANRGLELFNEMSEVHSIKPGLEHCISVVNLLCRTGRVEEAEAFISSSPFASDRTIWGTLLGSCTGEENADAPERAAGQLFGIDPLNRAGHVALCNWYARNGRFSEGGEVRREMREKGLRKVPGYSWVLINGRVYVFFSGDKLVDSQVNHVLPLLCFDY